MFKNEWPLFVGVASNARGISTYRQFLLLILKAAMGIMAIAAVHSALKHFVTERFRELCLRFGVARDAKLWFAVLQHCPISQVRPLCRRFANQSNRPGTLMTEAGTVGGMAVGTSDIVSPVFTAAEIVVIFLARMAC